VSTGVGKDIVVIGFITHHDLTRSPPSLSFRSQAILVFSSRTFPATMIAGVRVHFSTKKKKPPVKSRFRTDAITRAVQDRGGGSVFRV
jgi:hypothetical protein